MTKKELIEELKDLPDDCRVLLDEWSGGIFEWKDIDYVYSYDPSIVRLHPTDEPYWPESEKEEDFEYVGVLSVRRLERRIRMKIVTVYVDVPSSEGDEFINVEVFKGPNAKDLAIQYCKERWGADDEGRVNLLSVHEEDFEDEIQTPDNLG